MLSVALLVLAIVPGWSVEERLRLLGSRAQMDATRVALDPRDPGRRRVGGLVFLGGVSLTSRDPAFGGFSALSVDGDRFTLLSDGGNIVRFQMGADWQPHALAFSNLPAGPRTGWDKRDRDSEAMAVDPATRRVWVAFENTNAIWRYDPAWTRGEAQARPAAIRKWSQNGGPESLALMPDGRFVAISESSHVPPRAWSGSKAMRLRTRDARMFFGDPTGRNVRQARFAYVPAGRYDPADAAALPNGDLIVLDRDFALPFRWSNRLSIVRAADVAAGKVARGRLIATLAAPLIHDNFEGLAVTREGGDAILWLVSDDNQMAIQRSLLLKFRLALPRPTPKTRPR
ncbi:esterase-like activity of phytase family protein [Sphingomonas sp.]|jgi:hypothetical protein|uniref:esterase-like activity of phytase family protein n=1 Tax=Sphingomonas sp. TaxID=28214 RepID=UPI002EDB74CD